MQIERVASDNLREYSQSTQYIFDWSSHPPESQNTFKQHTALAQKKASQQRLLALKKVSSNQSTKNIVQKKTEKKQEILSRFEFPILEEALTKTSEGRKLIKSKMKSQLNKNLRRKEGLDRVLDQIVDEQYKKMNEYAYLSLNSQKQERLSSQYQHSQIHFRTKTNSLPFISKPKRTFISSKKLPILINNYKPEQKFIQKHISAPFRRTLKAALFQ